MQLVSLIAWSLATSTVTAIPAVLSASSSMKLTSVMLMKMLPPSKSFLGAGLRVTSCSFRKFAPGSNHRDGNSSVMRFAQVFQRRLHSSTCEKPLSLTLEDTHFSRLQSQNTFRRYSFRQESTALMISSTSSPNYDGAMTDFVEAPESRKLNANLPEKVSTPTAEDTKTSVKESPPNPLKINLMTISQRELEEIVTFWGYPSYRAKQILLWVRNGGYINPSNNDDIELSMGNNTILPKSLRELLVRHAALGSLQIIKEQISSKDFTIKRLYQLSQDSNSRQKEETIESVLMSYNDGRYTACISSQAGCAQVCCVLEF